MSTFEEAFDGLSLVAYRVAFRLLGEREDARDIAAEALARALPRWSKVEPYADAWVARVTANLALSELRKRARRRRPAPAEPAAGPHAAERQDLVDALRALSRRQREVVVLRYLADLPEAEVAQVLGCSAGTVKQHASRGLAALRLTLTVVEEA